MSEYADYVSRDELRRMAAQEACRHAAFRVVATCRACGRGVTVYADRVEDVPALLSVTVLCCRPPEDPPAGQTPAESSA